MEGKPVILANAHPRGRVRVKFSLKRIIFHKWMYNIFPTSSFISITSPLLSLYLFHSPNFISLTAITWEAWCSNRLLEPFFRRVIRSTRGAFLSRTGDEEIVSRLSLPRTRRRPLSARPGIWVIIFSRLYVSGFCRVSLSFHFAARVAGRLL